MLLLFLVLVVIISMTTTVVVNYCSSVFTIIMVLAISISVVRAPEAQDVVDCSGGYRKRIPWSQKYAHCNRGSNSKGLQW